jgi:hypothetical protein
MAKNDSVEWFKWVIGLLILVIMGLSGYFAHRLDTQEVEFSSRTSSQETEIAHLNKNFAVIVTFLNMKMPGSNLLALVNLSVNMNIPPEKVVAAINLLQTDPIKAKVYLDRELNFSVDQVNSIMRPIMIQDKKITH